jgi:hypothetical protein
VAGDADRANALFHDDVFVILGVFNLAHGFPAFASSWRT